MSTPEEGAESLLALVASPDGGLPDRLRLAQQLMEALPVPVFFKGRDGRYLGVNKAWEQFFDVSRDRMLGSTVRQLYAHAPMIAERHHAMDEALWAKPGRQSYEMALTTPDGQLRHTIYCKATFLGPDGKVAGLIGTIIDITDRKRAEQREAVENAVARYLGGDEPLQDAIRGIIQVICERLDFACGARWSLDEAENRLRCEESWSVEDPGIKSFLATSSRATFIPGRSGLIREVLATARSVWIADVAARPDFLRAGIASEAGLHCAFALPVMVGERVLGAVEFFSREARSPDPWLLQTAMSAGRLMGQLMARRHAEEELERLREELERLRPQGAARGAPRRS